MKKSTLALLIIALLVISIPAMAQRMAARNLAVPHVHETIEVYQAYPGFSGFCPEENNNNINDINQNVEFLGYLGTGDDVITSAPGILSIVPGENWENFVYAAQDDVDYFIKNVVLQKVTPEVGQCWDVFPPQVISQQGTPNIRLWWPLMYEVPSTTWTLTIVYGTYEPWADPANPYTPGYVHTEIWSWHLDATLESMSLLLQLFHQLPFGLDQVPLISDEVLYPQLQEMIAEIIAFVDAEDYVSAGLLLGEFEMEVMDACIPVSPLYPNPTGNGTGIAQTLENPACCKLLVDAEYIGFNLGIFQPNK